MPDMIGSRQYSCRFFEQRPCLFAKIVTPADIVTRVPEFLLERPRIDLVKHQTFGEEIIFESRVEIGDVPALLARGCSEVFRYDLLNRRREALPGGTVHQDTPAVPHMICERAVGLHLVEPRGRNDRQWILLPIKDPRLQR